MPAKISLDEEMMKAREMNAERRVENEIRLSHIELIILNQLQQSGSMTREELILPAPLSYRIDEEIALLQQRGYLIEEDNMLYYCSNAPKKYKH
jgi:hypothetical protein